MVHVKPVCMQINKQPWGSVYFVITYKSSRLLNDKCAYPGSSRAQRKGPTKKYIYLFPVADFFLNLHKKHDIQ